MLIIKENNNKKALYCQPTYKKKIQLRIMALYYIIIRYYFEHKIIGTLKN